MQFWQVLNCIFAKKIWLFSEKFSKIGNDFAFLIKFNRKKPLNLQVMNNNVLPSLLICKRKKPAERF